MTAALSSTSTKSSQLIPYENAFHAFLSKKLVVQDSERAKMRDALAEQCLTIAELSTWILVPRTFVERMARFLLALRTGPFLLVPIVMNFVSSQDMRLIIGSVFVVGFSLFLSFLSEPRARRYWAAPWFGGSCCIYWFCFCRVMLHRLHSSVLPEARMEFCFF